MRKKKSAERFSVWQIKLSEKNLIIKFIIIYVIFSKKLRIVEDLAIWDWLAFKKTSNPTI